MNIFWQGQFLFELITIPQKNSQLKIVIDPFDESCGLKIPNLEADILLRTHSEAESQTAKLVRGNPFLIEGPGEYDIKNVFIQGIQASNENTIYTIKSEEIKICHLGKLNQKELSSEQLETIGEIDILMIPVGGLSTLNGKEAIKIMSQIEPKITIPMYYSLPKLKLKLDGVDKFLKALAIKKIEPLAKLSIKKKDLPEDEAKIIILKP